MNNKLFKFTFAVIDKATAICVSALTIYADTYSEAAVKIQNMTVFSKYEAQLKNIMPN